MPGVWLGAQLSPARVAQAEPARRLPRVPLAEAFNFLSVTFVFTFLLFFLVPKLTTHV